MAFVDDDVTQHYGVSLDEKDIPHGPLEQPNYQTHDELGLSVINNREQELTSIIQYVSGMKCRGDYYNNLATKNDATTSQSNYLSSTIQKYNKINDIILYVQDGLSEETKIEEMELRAIINANIVPFLGDVFISNLIGPRVAIYEVKEINTKTYQLHKVYDITLKFRAFKDNSLDEFNDLEKKVVNEYFFDESYVSDYGTPILLREDLQEKLSIKDYKAKLVEFYLDNFVDPDTSMLNPFARPFNQDGNIIKSRKNFIDHYLNDFIRKIVNADDNYKFIKVSFPDKPMNDFNVETILDLLMDFKSRMKLTDIEYRLAFKRVPSNFTFPSIGQLVWLNVDKYVDFVTVDEDTSFSVDEETFLFTRTEKPDYYYPLHYKKDSYQSYIFSEAFYINNYDAMSPFEKTFLSFLETKNFPYSELVKYIESIKYWHKYEQFYIIPIIIFILNYKMHNTFSNR